MARDIDLHRFEREIDKWRCRIKDEDDRKTYDEVFDRQTLLTIYGLFQDGVFDILDYPIATGKEGNVFKANTREGDFVAVKIYRLSTATFRDMGKYILGDPRFKGVARRFPHLIYTWARKEYKNLGRFSDAGVRVPHPIAVEKNILVMEYIGDATSPARSLKAVGPGDPEDLAEHLLGCIRKAYVDGGIVHGDLSEYNILMTDDGPVIIDLAQGVLKEHWMAQELLERDVSNMAKYFGRYGVKIDVKAVLDDIRGGG